MNQLGTFINQSFRHFMSVGSVFPSSTYLAKRMTKNMNGLVILELGPGTGIFTKEILKKLPVEGRLISIESNKEFAKYIEDQINDNRFKLCIGDAMMLKSFLKENGIDKVDCVISGLPIGNFSKDIKHKLLKEISECLKDDGEFIQFEYLLAGFRAVRLVFPEISMKFELLNLPPAFIMRCKKF